MTESSPRVCIDVTESSPKMGIEATESNHKVCVCKEVPGAVSMSCGSHCVRVYCR